MTNDQPATPKQVPAPPPATGEGVLESSVANAEALWRAFASARDHRLIDEPDWLAVDARRGMGGTRVILRRPVREEAQRASLATLVRQVTWPVVVEDPFGTIDLHAEGLDPLALAVMSAGPCAKDATPSDSPTAEGGPGITVCRVEDSEALLLEADRIVVQGFPLASYQPYQPGRLLPAGLLDMPHVSVFVANSRGGQPCGTCMTVTDPHGVGGVYWVAVLPQHRRAGVGRALMLAAMQELAGLPIVLCATQSGAPLYRTLGFETALTSTYWQAHTRGF